MTVIRTIAKFEAAHRQFGDSSKCGYLHGHNWEADIEIESSVINDIGYIVDFKEIKDKIKEKYDHKVILNMYDPLVDILIDAGQKVCTIGGNPTCEVLARFIKDDVYEIMKGRGLKTNITVVLWENGDCYARE